MIRFYRLYRRCWYMLIAVIVWGQIGIGFASAKELPQLPDPAIQFVMPYDDASEGITNVKDLRGTPEKADKRIIVWNGHLHLQEDDGSVGRRVRLFGTNLFGEACFPTHEIAEIVAARMARFGINCVRLHKMDRAYKPEGIFTDVNMDELDEEQLDRLDYLIYQLKEHGIYVDLNLQAGRTFPSTTEMPHYTGYPSASRGLDIFYRPMIEKQKEYAEKLLSHDNPYIPGNVPYAEEPAIVFVEINNEDGLLFQWWQWKLESMPREGDAAVYRNALKEQWNNWLTNKYGSDDMLESEWGKGIIPFDDEMLGNGSFSNTLSPWYLENHDNLATYTLEPNGGPKGGPALRVDVHNTGVYYYVKVNQKDLSCEEGMPYTVSFWAKADAERTIKVYIGRNYGSYNVLASSKVSLTTSWQYFTVTLTPKDSDSNVRFGFDELALQTGSVWLADVSMKPRYGPEMLDTEMIDDTGKLKPPWYLEKNKSDFGNATYTASETPDGSPAVCVNVSAAYPENELYKLKVHHKELQFESNQSYILTFWAKSDNAQTIYPYIAMSQSPWSVLGKGPKFELTNAWKQYTVELKSSASESNGRLCFSDFGGKTGKVWIGKVSLRPCSGLTGVPDNESLGTINILDRGTYTKNSERKIQDWIHFMWDNEEAYWREMRDYLKNDLGCQSLLIGTQCGQSPVPIQAKYFDVIDMHSYWEHPTFPNVGWSSTDWYINNTSVTTSADGGNITRVASRRVEGKPFVVTEINHPAPNVHGAEDMTLHAIYGGLQDWDGIFSFSFSLYDYQRITGHFDVGHHPTKMVMHPIVAALFLRGDVSPAENEYVAAVSSDMTRDLLLAHRAASIGTYHVGIDQRMALQSKVMLDVDESVQDLPTPISVTDEVIESDTGEIKWDSTAGQQAVTVDAPKSKAIIGVVDGRTFGFDNDELTVTVGDTDNNWAAIALSVMEGEDFSSPGKILLVATGNVGNEGMVWEWYNEEAGTVTVRNNWATKVGKDIVGKSIVEGINASIKLPVAADMVKVWVLDNRGQRTGVTLPVQAVDANHSVFEINENYATLWYEITIGDVEARWGFNNSAADDSGNGYEAILHGSPTYVTECQEGSHSLSLDGEDDWVQLDNVASKIEGDWSFSAWVKAPSNTKRRCIFSICTQSGGNKLRFYVNSNKLGVYGPSTLEASTNTIVADNQWHHIVYTCSGNIGTIYVDGVAKGTHQLSYTLSATDQWSLGQEFDGTIKTDFFDGCIDDVRLYNFALTPEAVALLNNR